MSARSRQPDLGQDDRAVSPVVGMILVLGISVVGIAAILYWGLPAIDEMKANVEYRSVTTQFTELDNTIHELTAGTTEKTAKRWEPSINRGEIGVANRSEGWVYSIQTYAGSAYNFTFSDLADGDNWFNITNQAPSAAVANFKIEGYLVTGSASQTTLNVTDNNLTVPAQMGSNATSWPVGTKKQISVWQADLCCATPATSMPKQNLQDNTFHFKITSGGTLIAEMWWVQTGRVEYKLHAGVGDKTVVLNNGAVIDGAGGSYAIVNTPSIPPDSSSSGVPRFFGRAVALNGSASFAGDQRFSLLVSLYSTTPLSSYDCVSGTYTDCVSTVRLEMFGTYASVWQAYLKNPAMGYRFAQCNDALTGTTALCESNHHMAFTLLGSNLRLT